jgi:hypothetical protein
VSKGKQKKYTGKPMETEKKKLEKQDKYLA